MAGALFCQARTASAQLGGLAYVAPTNDGPAGESGPSRDEPPPAPEEHRYGINIDMGVESAWVSRGLNIAQKTSQLDQNPILNPSVNWTIGESGLTVGLAGTYQWAGDNREDLIRAGIGNQQDVNLMYERKLSDRWTAYAGLTYSFFPFADPEVVGTAVPSILEPKVAIALHSQIDIGLQLVYTACLQDEIAAGRHFYIHPVLWKTIEIDQEDALDVTLSGGAKLWDDPEITDNVADLQADIVYSRELTSTFHAKPGLHYAWTNLADVGFEKEQVVWFSLHGGLDL